MELLLRKSISYLSYSEFVNHNWIICCVVIRMGKRKRNSEHLAPCLKRVESISDEPITVGDEVDVCDKVLMHQTTRDESISEDEEISLCGIPLSRVCNNTQAGVTFVLEKASLTLAYVGKVSAFVSLLWVNNLNVVWNMKYFYD